VDPFRRREGPAPGVDPVDQLELTVLGGTRQMQDADGIERVIGRYIVEMPAEPIAEDIGIGGAYRLPGGQTAVGSAAPDSLVTLARGDSLCLQLIKIPAAERHKSCKPRLAARHKLPAEVGQAVGGARRLHCVKAPADGCGHRLAGGMGYLIEQHRLVTFPPQIIQRVLGVGVKVDHAGAGKVPVGQHPRHGAKLIVGQRPVCVGRHAVGVKGAVPDLDPAAGKLAAERLRHRRIGQQRHGAARVLSLGAAERRDGAAVIDCAAQIGGVPFTVAFQRGKRAENQIFHGQTPPLHKNTSLL
jgi:hypothetical protein